MKLFYAIICRFLPKKLVAFALLLHAKQITKGNMVVMQELTVVELFDKLTGEN
jgi:hypothetical protein